MSDLRLFILTWTQSVRQRRNANLAGWSFGSNAGRNAVFLSTAM